MEHVGVDSAHSEGSACALRTMLLCCFVWQLGARDNIVMMLLTQVFSSGNGDAVWGGSLTMDSMAVVVVVMMKVQLLVVVLPENGSKVSLSDGVAVAPCSTTTQKPTELT